MWAVLIPMAAIGFAVYGVRSVLISASGSSDEWEEGEGREGGEEGEKERSEGCEDVKLEVN